MSKKRPAVISAREAAERLNEDPRTVQRKAKSGVYPAQKLPGLRGAYVFDPRTIDRIIAERAA